MPIEKTYRDSIEIIDISKVTTPYHRTYKTLILTFQSKVLQSLLDNALIKPIDDLLFGSSHGKYHAYEVIDNENIIFFLSPIGAPTTVGILEEMTYRLKIENVVMYGSCGLLDHNAAKTKLIIPTKAYRDEGTSYHYMKASEFVEINHYQIVEHLFKEANIPYTLGYTWTTDAFYRETEAIVKERIEQGCITVEMEVSAIQAFANLRKIQFYPFLYGADSLIDLVWDKKTLGSEPISSHLWYFRIAVYLASKLS